ncbi:MAG: SDR family NAD(P)-dependent oxidoreductase, partial [Deltaproteobacteria bacterium]|nr:SDR family NAD(P)-dependent oxidoreductase [Deltaproteobacteria bacterium]
MSDTSSTTAPRRALVTGSTSGIGRATALALARDGFEVIVHGRDATRGEETVAAIREAGGVARLVLADLSDDADRARLADEAADVEVLVNNGGTSWSGPSADLVADRYDRLFDGNVRATYFLTAA